MFLSLKSFLWKVIDAGLKKERAKMTCDMTLKYLLESNPPTHL